MIRIDIPSCEPNFKFKHALILKFLKINVHMDIFCDIYILKNYY